jgi:hypothetical protein
VTTAASLSPIASSRELRRANALDDDNAAEAFTVIDVIIVVANEQQHCDCCQIGLDNHPGARRWQNLWRGRDNDDNVATAVRQLPSKRRGKKDATIAALPPPPIPLVTLMPMPTGNQQQ